MNNLFKAPIFIKQISAELQEKIIAETFSILWDMFVTKILTAEQRLPFKGINDEVKVVDIELFIDLGMVSKELDPSWYFEEYQPYESR